jgi:hypothetical protein
MLLQATTKFGTSVRVKRQIMADSIAVGGKSDFERNIVSNQYTTVAKVSGRVGGSMILEKWYFSAKKLFFCRDGFRCA